MSCNGTFCTAGVGLKAEPPLPNGAPKGTAAPASRANRCLPEGSRRRFTEDAAIGDREAAEFPETEFRGDAGDRGLDRRCPVELPAGQMEAPQAQVALGADPEHLLADLMQCPLADAECG